MEQCGRWLQQACTTMFFLIPENVTSERPIALMQTMIRWWEALRAPEVQKWQYKHRIEWCATDGRNEGADCVVWVYVLYMDRCNFQAGEKDQGAIALVLVLAKPPRGSVSQWSGLGQRISMFPGRLCVCQGGYLEHQRRLQFEVWRSRSRPSRPPYPGSKWSCLLLRIVSQDGLSQVTKFPPPLQLRVLGDTTAF